MALNHRGNVVTPLHTLGLKVNIDDMNPRAHTAIFGNDDARPSRMLKGIIEHDLSRGRKVIAIGFNTSYAGLSTGNITVVDLTRVNRSFQINMAQLPVLAALIVASPHSFAIDIGGYEPGPAARIIERIAACLSVQEHLVAPTTLAIDLIDVATPRRRMGLDADAVQQVNSFLGRAFDLGARLVMAANAPGEMPVEYANGTVQAVICRLTGVAVDSVAKFIRDNRLVTEANRKDIGISSIPTGDYWFCPMTDDAFGPYLVELPELVTEVGDRDQSRRVTTRETAAFCEDYAAKVAEAIEAEEMADARRIAEAKMRKMRVEGRARAIIDEEMAASVVGGRERRTALRAKASAPATRSNAATRPTVAELVRVLEAAGFRNRPACRARCLVTDAQMQDRELTVAEAVAETQRDEVSIAIRFGETLYKAKLLAKTTAAAMGYRLLKEHEPEQVEAFRLALLKGDEDDVVGRSGARLRAMTRTSLEADSRIQAFRKAWRDHQGRPIASQPPVAVNDDLPMDRAA